MDEAAFLGSICFQVSLPINKATQSSTQAPNQFLPRALCHGGPHLSLRSLVISWTLAYLVIMRPCVWQFAVGIAIAFGIVFTYIVMVAYAYFTSPQTVTVFTIEPRSFTAQIGLLAEIGMAGLPADVSYLVTRCQVESTIIHNTVYDITILNDAAEQTPTTRLDGN